MASTKKLCVICLCDDDYNIHIVDLNGGGGEAVTTAPNIRLRGFGTGTYFCGSGSTLHIFNASGLESAYEIDLDDQKSDFVFEKSLMHPSTAAAMPSRKFYPLSIPTPDGKIIVAASSIFFNSDMDKDLMDEDDRIDHPFEMFDPISKSWSDLPDLCLRSGGSVIKMRSGFDDESESAEWVELRARATRPAPNRMFDSPYYFSVGGACFANSHTFLVHIMNDYYEMSEFVSLDLHSLDKGWQLYEGWMQCIKPQHGFRTVVEDKLVLSAYSCYRRASSDCIELPQSGQREIRWLVPTDHLQDSEQFSFCVVRLSLGDGFVREEQHLAADVLELDGSGHATLKTSFKIWENRATSFFIENSFMISPTPCPFKKQDE